MGRQIQPVGQNPPARAARESAPFDKVLHRFAGKGLVSANLSAVPTETMASYLEAGITHYCHPRAGGDPFSRRQSKWIPACAGMTLEIDGFRQSLFLTCAKQGKSAFRWGKARAIVSLGEIMRSPQIGEEPCQRGPTRRSRAGGFWPARLVSWPLADIA